MSSKYSAPYTGFKKVLYVTDLSENSRQAFPVAACMAKQFKASLTVFHVVETEHFEKYLTGYISEEMWEQLKTRDLDEAREVLIDRKRGNSVIKDSVDRICQESLVTSEHDGCIDYDIVVRLGEPADKIVAETIEQDYDLVIIGNRGKRSIRETLIGSTARRVLATCNVPVMIVPMP